jgi:hypothetical protein
MNQRIGAMNWEETGLSAPVQNFSVGVERVVHLTVSPLTPELWAALEDLFGKKGACNGCWCMYWRIGAIYRKQPVHRNKAAFEEIVKRGLSPGLIAFGGDLANGLVPAYAARCAAVVRSRLAAQAHGRSSSLVAFLSLRAYRLSPEERYVGTD